MKDKGIEGAMSKRENKKRTSRDKANVDVMKVRTLEKKENIRRTLAKMNDSLITNEKRCEGSVRSKDIEDAVRVRSQGIIRKRKREYYRSFDKKKTIIVLTNDKKREGSLMNKQA
jgi:hypothetical protein